MQRINILPLFRKIHLYLGVFAAPAIVFFSLTGVLQTFSLHETSRGSAYQPAKWIVVLAQIHKKQTPQIPVRRGPSGPPPPRALPAAGVTPEGPRSSGDQQHNALPLKIFFLVVGLTLASSTVTGLYLAWKYKRSRVMMAGTLVAGIVIPILLIFF